jgi:hypothetical protein
MLVKFTPNGETMDTNLAWYAVGPYKPARTLVALDSDPTNIPVISVKTSGTPLAITGLSAEGSIVWYVAGVDTPIRIWKMNSLAAAQTGVDALFAAQAADPTDAVTLSAAGVVA